MTRSGSDARAIAEALRLNLPLTLGSLRVWGDWFGRPFDNAHVAVAASAADETLVIEFDDRERLVIVRPSGYVLDPTAGGSAPRLAVSTADRVEWGWYAYGRPQVEENWFVETHWRESGEIRASTTATWYQPSFRPTEDEPAVAFL